MLYQFCITAEEDLQIETSCTLVKLMLCSKLTILPFIVTISMNLYNISVQPVCPASSVCLSVCLSVPLQVWDMRTKACIHTLTGHSNTVSSVLAQAANPQVCVCVCVCVRVCARVCVRACVCACVVSPSSSVLLPALQVITASHDSTIRLWDLAAGKTSAVLTNHKKSIRSVVLHPSE